MPEEAIKTAEGQAEGQPGQNQQQEVVPGDVKKGESSLFKGKTFTITLPGGETKKLKGDQTLADLDAAEKKSKEAAKEGEKPKEDEKSAQDKGEPETPSKKEGGKEAEEEALIREDDPKGVKKRIGEALKLKREAETRAAALEDRLSKIEERLATKPAEPDEKSEDKVDTGRPVKPQEENFNTLEEYEAARDKYTEDLTDWKVAEAFRRDREAREKKEQATIEQEQEKAHNEKLAKGRKLFPEDFDETAISNGLDYSDTMCQTIYAIENPEIFARVAYELGTQPDEVKRIFGLSPIEQIKAIGRIEDRLLAAQKNESKDKEVPEKSQSGLSPGNKRITNASEPIKPLNSGGSPPVFDPTKADAKAIKQYLNAKAIARIRGEK